MRKTLGTDVFTEALNRLLPLYEDGHRVVCCISGGKDSTIALELCVLAATLTSRLPVEACVRDEEIIYPGVPEYLRTIEARDDVILDWYVSRKAMVNVFCRANPFWWIFDERVPEQWVVPWPENAIEIPEPLMKDLVSVVRYPPPEGKRLYTVLGIRAEESRMRALSVASSGGALTRHPDTAGAYRAKPIYDWRDGDVWRAMNENAWPYAAAYDTLARLGVRGRHLRIGPPTMNATTIGQLRLAATAWPQWFGRVCRRLPGVKTAVQFNGRGLAAERLQGETWQQTFDREVLGERAPEWIRERATTARDIMLARHREHATTPFPEVKQCMECGPSGSWKRLVMYLYNGDPFASRISVLPPADYDSFRDLDWKGRPL